MSRKRAVERSPEANERDLAVALGLVLDRMGCHDETIEQAVEAVADDFGGRVFGEALLAYARGER